MSSRQFQEWRAYADLEPFDETRADLRSAQIVQTLTNLALARAGKRRALSLQDCVLDFDPQPGAPAADTAEEARANIKRVLDDLAAAFPPPAAPEQEER